jgi:hypothetical protein
LLYKQLAKDADVDFSLFIILVGERFLAFIAKLLLIENA